MLKNPIAWAHLHQSSTRRLWVYPTLLALGGITLITLVSYASSQQGPGEFAQAMFMLRQTSIGLLAAVLIVLGILAGGKAAGRDRQQMMLDSHRLMPISSAQAMLGYAFGTQAMTLLLAGVVLTAGVYLSTVSSASIATHAVGSYLFAAIVLASTASVLWIASAAAGLASAKTNVLTGVVFGLAFGGGSLISLLLPLAVFLPPLAYFSIWDIRPQQELWPYGVAMLMQLMAAVPIFVLGCRGYRREGDGVFGPGWSLWLLATWCLATLIAAAQPHRFLPRWSGGGEVSAAAVQVTMLVTMVLLCGPIWAAFRQRVSPRPDQKPWDRLPPTAVALIGVLLAASPLLAMAQNAPTAVSWTLALIAGHAAMMLACLSLLFVVPKSAGKLWPAAAVMVVLLWAVPPMVDGIRQALDNLYETPTDFAAFSPAWMMTDLWQETSDSTLTAAPWKAVAAELALAAVLGAAAFMLGRRRRASGLQPALS